LAQLGKRSGVGVDIIRSVLPAEKPFGITDSEIESALADSLYAGYIETQRLNLQRLHQHDSLKIRPDFVFRGLSGLSHEMVERLERAQPQTFGEVRRIPGLTSAALSMLLVQLAVQRQAA
jgi:tRNA uridine 5-carboxymethylaminomethyl modification enzyme